MERVEDNFDLIDNLGLKPFRERFPWFGGDLQTLRDTFVKDYLPEEKAKAIEILVPETPSGLAGAGKLLAFLDLPDGKNDIRGLVLMLHGLGGSSRRRGLRRMSVAFLSSGFAVLRLNLRGADPGRKLAGGTYAAQCNSDLFPVINRARNLCKILSNNCLANKIPLPLYGVGISLGGTILLNASLDKSLLDINDRPLLDGLVCISSPLDLEECSASIERDRNRLYQNWILQRLLRQTLEDPFESNQKEKQILFNLKSKKRNFIKNIRQFDSLITAPRWGYENVESYYNLASPINKIIDNLNLLPSTLLVQAVDDPWVPFKTFEKLRNQISKTKYKRKIHFVLSNKGGHNGFHGQEGCWGDSLIDKWLLSL